AVLSKIKTTSVSASVSGAALPPETYTQAGEFDYTRDVEGRLLPGEAVNVEVSLAKYLPAGMVEPRGLGLIVASVGFEAKGSRHGGEPPGPFLRCSSWRFTGMA